MITQLKNVQKFFLYLFSAFLLFGLQACEKYEDGAIESDVDDKIISTWKLQSYYLNGTDETSSIFITNYSEKYTENRTFTRIYTDKNGDMDYESGSWRLSDDNKEVQISGVSSINDFSDKTNSVSSSKFIILKLTDSEYWYYFINGSDKHEFHFTK